MIKLEPTVLYLDEKPPKVVKSKKTKAARKAKKPTKKKEIKKSITKPTKKLKNLAKTVKEFFIDHKKALTEDNDEKEENKNDPLYTPKVKIKLEPNEEKFECEVKRQYDHKDQNYQTEDEQDEEVTDDEDKDSDFDVKIDDDYYNDDDDDDYDNEDEPLILLTRRISKTGKSIKVPKPAKCEVSCKYHCVEKFTEEQRNLLCDTFWQLNKENRLAFLREHMRTQSLFKYTFSDRKSKRSINKYCYYLKDCQNINCDVNVANRDVNLIKVCHTYFKTTLSVSDFSIRKAVNGYKLPEDPEIVLLSETIKAKREREKVLAQQIKQHLDPATGNLIIIDPKDKTKKTCDLKPKRIYKRRKPGDPVPKRFPKPINCAVKCIFKCHTKFTEEERTQICDSFWSMDYKQRKDFLLANLERKQIKRKKNIEFCTTKRAPRSHHIHYFLRTKMHGEKIRVCEKFLNNTLSITRDFIDNALKYADQITGCYTGADRRGHRTTSRKHPEERIKLVLDHITSYPKWVPHIKSKTKYLHHSLNIKRMFEEYKINCEMAGIKPVANIYYYKYFHDRFRLKFLNNPDPNRRGGCVSKNPTISHYTGEEPAGMWLDVNDEKLDLNQFNPAQSMIKYQQFQQQQQHYSINSNSSQDALTNIAYPSTSLQLNPLNFTTALPAAHHLAGLIDPSLASIAYNSSSRFSKV